MALKPQDVLVVMKLLAEDEQVLPYAQMAVDLGMSVSEAHASVRRLQDGELVTLARLSQLGSKNDYFRGSTARQPA